MSATSEATPYRWDDAKRRRSLREDFGVDRDRFADAAVLEVSSGTSMINGMDGPSRRVVALPPGEDPCRYDDATRVRSAHGRLPFPDDSFDLAVTVHGLTSARDPSRMAREFRRVLRPDSLALYEVNGFTAPGAVRKRLSLVDGSHRYHLPPDTIRDVIADAGFEVESTTVRRDDVDPGNQTAKLLVANLAFGLRRVFVTARATP
jgi:SAM-dependent methyltransferase